MDAWTPICKKVGHRCERHGWCCDQALQQMIILKIPNISIIVDNDFSIVFCPPFLATSSIRYMLFDQEMGLARMAWLLKSSLFFDCLKFLNRMNGCGQIWEIASLSLIDPTKEVALLVLAHFETFWLSFFLCLFFLRGVLFCREGNNNG